MNINVSSRYRVGTKMINRVCGAFSMLLIVKMILYMNPVTMNIMPYLDRCDKIGITNLDSEIETYMININFSEDEISSALDTLKLVNLLDLDAILAEFINHCKDVIARDITTVVNYIIEERNFPDMWAEGLRSAVFLNRGNAILSAIIVASPS